MSRPGPVLCITTQVLPDTFYQYRVRFTAAVLSLIIPSNSSLPGQWTKQDSQNIDNTQGWTKYGKKDSHFSQYKLE